MLCIKVVVYRHALIQLMYKIKYANHVLIASLALEIILNVLHVYQANFYILANAIQIAQPEHSKILQQECVKFVLQIVQPAEIQLFA